MVEMHKFRHKLSSLTNLMSVLTEATGKIDRGERVFRAVFQVYISTSQKHARGKVKFTQGWPNGDTENKHRT